MHRPPQTEIARCKMIVGRVRFSQDEMVVLSLPAVIEYEGRRYRLSATVSRRRRGLLLTRDETLPGSQQ